MWIVYVYLHLLINTKSERGLWSLENNSLEQGQGQGVNPWNLASRPVLLGGTLHHFRINGRRESSSRDLVRDQGLKCNFYSLSAVEGRFSIYTVFWDDISDWTPLDLAKRAILNAW